MALDLAALRAAFAPKDKTQGSRGPSNYFPFFQMEEGDQSTVRFLPDLNPENPLGFLVPKHTHVLKINGRDRSIPCLKMYGKECPICKVAAAYYNAGDRTNGQRYYRKVQHLAQALVMQTNLMPQDTEDNYNGTVRLVQLSPQIYKVIQEAIMSGDLEEFPYDYEFGTNFIIKKDRQGDYPTYSFSKFAKRESALSEAEIAYAKSQLKDLSSLLPAEPPLEEVEALLEAEMTGGQYNPTGGQTQAPRAQPSAAPRPQPVAQADEDDDSTAAALAALTARRQPTPVPTQVQEEDDDDSVNDVLAALAARRQSRSV